MEDNLSFPKNVFENGKNGVVNSPSVALITFVVISLLTHFSQFQNCLCEILQAQSNVNAWNGNKVLVFQLGLGSIET